MTNWPKIKYEHIFAYFIIRPGTYTQEELLSWKQLEAYNYYKCGYVRMVLSMVFGHGKRRCVANSCIFGWFPIFPPHSMNPPLPSLFRLTRKPKES